MTANPIGDALLIDPKGLLLEMAQQQSVAELLKLIVTRLTESRRGALAC